MDTHIHADDISAAHYLKERLGGNIGISTTIKDILALWIPTFNTSKDTHFDASQFDYVFEDGAVFKPGTVDVKVLHTLGHAPACSSYLI